MFSLPTGDELAKLFVAPAGTPTIRSAQRRCRRKLQAVRLLDRGIRALNELAGSSSSASVGSLSSVQTNVIDSLYKQFDGARLGSVAISGEAAYQQLLRLKSGYAASEPCSGTFPTYRRGAVKLPPHGAGQYDLCDMMPPGLAASLRSGEGIIRVPAALDLSYSPPGRAMDLVLRR